MIKINLYPLKRKKKAKPVPSFVILLVILTVATALVMTGLFFTYNARISSKKAQHKANEAKIATLKEKIKEVEKFEELNRTTHQKNSVIEQLRKNQSAPVKLLDEISKLLPPGVWLNTLTVIRDDVSMDGYAFSNSDIVAYVDNMKKSQVFTEVYLIESKSTAIETIPLYVFKLTFKMRA